MNKKPCLLVRRPSYGENGAKRGDAGGCRALRRLLPRHRCGALHLVHLRGALSLRNLDGDLLPRVPGLRG